MTSNPFNEDTTRRRVCAALAVVGGASLAGCSDEVDESGTATSSDPAEGEVGKENDDGDGSVNPAKLIDSHVSALSGSSYTVYIEKLQSDNQDPLKELEYRFNPDKSHSWISETTQIDGRVSSAEQYFTESEQQIGLGLDNEIQNRSSLPIDNGPLFINGGSLFDQLLIGSELFLDNKDTNSDQQINEYTVNGHRHLEEVSGDFVVVDEGRIQELRIEWNLPDGTERYEIRFEITEFGSTSVEAML